MTMTRQHFALIAEALSSTKPGAFNTAGPDRLSQWTADIEAVAHGLRSTNPNFNRARFLRACGVDDA